MSELLETGGLATHKIDGEPMDAKRYPLRRTVVVDLDPYGLFRFLLIGPINLNTGKMRVDLAQALDRFTPFQNSADWRKLRLAIYDAMQTQVQLIGHGLHESMVDVIP